VPPADTTGTASDLFREHVRRYVETGDHRSANVIAERALRLALPTALAVLGNRNDASDVAQEAAVQVLRRVEALRSIEAFPMWVHRITANRAFRLSSRRRVRASREALVGEWADQIDALTQSPDVADVLDQDIEMVDPAIRLAMRALPMRQRMVVALRYVHDLSDEDIADAVGIRAGTVGALLSRARITLREHPAMVAYGRREGYLDD
jgi:RNA polymerase sigma factor (sigma-70 family)